MTIKENQKCIIRCEKAGVFYAEVAERNGTEATLRNCRRVWHWDGAASLSQLAMEGVNKPSKITVVVPEMVVLGVIEIIPVTSEAEANLDKVLVWRV